MLINKENAKNIKKISEQEKKGEFFCEDLILCSNRDKDLLDMMIKGYKEMESINLQLAIESENELIDVIEYETWLCGV